MHLERGIANLDPAVPARSARRGRRPGLRDHGCDPAGVGKGYGAFGYKYSTPLGLWAAPGMIFLTQHPNPPFSPRRTPRIFTKITEFLSLSANLCAPFAPSALKTQNPKPKTQNPKPKTQNPKLKTQNPKLSSPPVTSNSPPTSPPAPAPGRCRWRPAGRWGKSGPWCRA